MPMAVTHNAGENWLYPLAFSFPTGRAEGSGKTSLCGAVLTGEGAVLCNGVFQPYPCVLELSQWCLLDSCKLFFLWGRVKSGTTCVAILVKSLTKIHLQYSQKCTIQERQEAAVYACGAGKSQFHKANQQSRNSYKFLYYSLEMEFSL